MSLLGISPTQTVLDQREIDWKNAKLIGNGASAIFFFLSFDFVIYLLLLVPPRLHSRGFAGKTGAFGHTKVFQTRWRGIECAVKRVKKDSLSLADLRAIQTEIDTVR